MAYYLEFDGVDDYVTIPTWSVGANDDFEITATINPEDADGLILGKLSSGSFYGYPFGDVFFANGTGFNTGVSIIPYVNTLIELTYRRVSGQHFVDIDGVNVYASAGVNFGAFSFEAIGRNNAGFYFKGDLYRLKLVNPTGTRHYNPTLSAEAGGTLLIDEVGGNHGTLNGFSADPFAYYYDFLNPSDEDTTADNCLVFDGSTNYVTLTQPALGSGDFDFEIDFEVNEDITNAFLYCSHNGAYGFNLYAQGGGSWAAAQGRVYIFQGDSSLNVTGLSRDTRYKLRYKRVGVDSTVYLDGVTYATKQNATYPPVTAASTTAAIGRHPTINNYYFQGKVFSTSINSPNGNQFYDLNRSPATAPVVPELINGQNGTMVNFPEPSGYVKDASNEIVGYRFNGVDTYAELETPLSYSALDDVTVTISGTYYSGAGTDYIIYSPTSFIRFEHSNNRIYWQADGSTAYADNPLVHGDTYTIKFVKLGSGTGQELFLNGVSLFTFGSARSFAITQIAKILDGILSNVLVEDSTTTYNYDFTLGDDDEIIDTVGGNNADIINAPTAGYLPIIEKQVFTVDDYATLPLFVTAESANSDYREYLAGTTAGATISGFSDGVIINGGTVTSPITLTQTGIAQIKNAKLDDIDATGASGDVTIIDCEVEYVTS